MEEKKEQRKGEKTQLREKGVVALPKPSIAKVTFGREKKKMGQTAPAPSTRYPASNWRFVSYMIAYMFQFFREIPIWSLAHFSIKFLLFSVKLFEFLIHFDTKWK